MNYLILVAHPDDEVLGAGASIRKWTKNGDKVDIAIMCTEIPTSLDIMLIMEQMQHLRTLKLQLILIKPD